MSARWSFIGHPLRSDLPASWPEGIPVREEPDGCFVYRERTEEQVDVPRYRCRCSHGASVHTGGYGNCHIFVCACRRFRDPESDPELAASQARHPAGKANPTDKDDQ